MKTYNNGTMKMRNKWTWVLAGCLLFMVLAGCSPGSSHGGDEPSIQPVTDAPVVRIEAPDPTVTTEPPAPTLANIDAPPTQPDEEDNVAKEAGNSPSPEPALQLKVEQAKQDLARRLDVDEEEVTVLEARQVVWPDGSLGCPQPGMVYTQALVPGLLIRLGVGGRMYFYHSGGSTDPFLCEQTSQVIPKVTPKFDEFVPPPDSEID